MQKVACGVILYNPDIEKVIKDIIRYSSLFDEVILFDNTSKECEKIQRYIEDLPNVSYLRDQLSLTYVLWKENMGFDSVKVLGRNPRMNPRLRYLTHKRGI